MHPRGPDRGPGHGPVGLATRSDLGLSPSEMDEAYDISASDRWAVLLR